MATLRVVLFADYNVALQSDRRAFIALAFTVLVDNVNYEICCWLVIDDLFNVFSNVEIFSHEHEHEE